MMTFKEFIKRSKNPLARDDKKEHNRNDQAERAMIHKIISLNNMEGGQSEKNYDLAYTFLESDWGGALWDKYYELFTEMSPNFEGPFNKRRYSNFRQDAVYWFRSWKNGKEFKGTIIKE